MDGGEIQRGRGAVRQQRPDQPCVDLADEGEIGVAAFQRKGARLQPILQRQVERGAELRELRRVDVQVDQAGQQDLVAGQLGQAAGVTEGGDVWIVRRHAGLHCHDVADGIDDDEGVRQDFDRIGRVDRPAEHCLLPVRNACCGCHTSL